MYSHVSLSAFMGTDGKLTITISEFVASSESFYAATLRADIENRIRKSIPNASIVRNK